jgi:hypothetical protein
MSSPVSQIDTAGTVALRRLAGGTVADRLDFFVLLVSRAAASLFFILTAAIVIHVVLRYVAGINLVWLEELHWQLYAFLATLGVASAAATDSHVRQSAWRQQSVPVHSRMNPPCRSSRWE